MNLLKPHKYLNLESSVLSIASLILKKLIKNKTVSITEIENTLRKDGENYEQSKYNLLCSLNFLYCVGKIEYIVEKDKILLIS